MHSIWRISLALTFNVFFYATVSAQWRDPILTRLGPEAGLPALIHCITQDSIGYLYFGSSIGLHRYDGHSFEYFGHDPLDTATVGGGEVYTVYPARDGLVWIGLRFDGLNSFDPKTGKFRRYPLPPLPYRSVPGTSSILEDSNGQLWVGSNNFRLLKFDRNTANYTEYTPDWIDPWSHGGRLAIGSIVQDPHNEDTLWLSVLDFLCEGAPSGSYGIVSFSKSTGKFTQHPCSGRIRVVDSLGNFWSTIWGADFFKYEPKSGHCQRVESISPINSSGFRTRTSDIISYNGNLLAVNLRGVTTIHPSGEQTEFLRIGNGSPFLSNGFVDNESNLWFGTDHGTMILDPEGQHIRFYSLSKHGSLARIFPGKLTYYPPTNTVYLAHFNIGAEKRLYEIPLDLSEKDNVQVIPTEFDINGIAFDNRNTIWIAGDGRIHTFDPVSRKTTPVEFISTETDTIPGVLHLKSNAAGWIAGGRDQDLIWFHRDSLQLKHLNLSDFPGSDFAKSFDNYIDGISMGSGHHAYLFSNEAFRIDLTSGEVTAIRYDMKFNPHLQHVQYAGEDPSGKLWMSTVVGIIGGSLVEDSLLITDIFTTGDGLTSPFNQELHPDYHGRIWSFSVSGMNAIDPTTREVRYFNTNQGLPLAYIDPRQVINVGKNAIATVCGNGLIVFNTEDLWSSMDASDRATVIKQIRIGGEPLQSDQSINFLPRLSLKPGVRTVDIEFQALTFPLDYRVKYSYRIIGLHDNWISIDQNRFVTLPSLAPGDYTFEVKAGSPVSLAPVKRLDIHVATPFYRQWWFIIFATLMIIALIFSLVQLRIRRIRQVAAAQAEVNKKIAELELKALRSQMNPHFMFNSLNSIKNYILQAEPRLAAEYLSNFAHLIRMILQNSREKTISLNDELETLKLYIELEQLRFEDAFEFTCDIDDSLNLDTVRIPPMLLQPYVENAIWHGLMHKKEHGHLRLQFQKENGTVTCIIDDDGVGRQQAMEMKSLSAVRYKSMGMGITKDRIEIMNKMDALGIDSEIIDKTDDNGNATGTTVIVHIPEQDNALI